MGYYVKSLPWKKSTPRWKVQYISYKKSDTKRSRAKKPKREWDISGKRWQALGFHDSMTRLEAMSRAKQLNAQGHLRRQEEQVKKIIDEQNKAQRRSDTFLPLEFVAEFETRFIRKRDSQTEQGLRKNTRAFTTWRAAQRMIVAVGLDPSEWFLNAHPIYDYFHEKKMSIRYIGAVLGLANLWGFYISRKMARPFLRIPPPRGYERQRLVDASYEKTKGVSRASKPIGPNDLDTVRSVLNQKNLHWLFLSVWFGLRPKEIDLLKRKDFWKVETLPNGRKILWVFQTKIVALPKEDRWKPIPIIFEEQQFGLRIIESQNFKRPLMKTIRKHFGVGVTLYAGRKGFSDFMLSKGQSFENISIWMGHSSLQRTWRSYKSRRKFHVAGY